MRNSTMNLPHRVENVLIFVFFLLGTAILAESASSTPIPAINNYFCPSGFDLVSAGQCRGFAQRENHLGCAGGYEKAVDICKGLNAVPPIIRNQEDSLYWASFNTTTQFNYKIIGIGCNETTKKWQWVDGTEIDFRPPSGHPDLNKPCVAGAGTWFYYDNTQIWYYAIGPNSLDAVDIYCISDLKKPELRKDDCIQFNKDDQDAICYQLSETPEYWSDAQDKCKTVGANLASIHSSKANQFVHDLAMSKGLVNGLYLGGTASGKANEFGWSDGSPWNYTNFLPGFPINGFGDCITMSTGDLKGEWANGGCNAKLPSVCSRKPFTDSPPNYCHGADIKEGDIVRTPGFPTDASTYCDFTLRVAQRKQVEIEVLLLEANNCCDQFVLYEVTAAGDKMIANLTGAISGTKYRTPSSNLMRASWQPKGGVNVRGAMFTFRGV